MKMKTAIIRKIANAVILLAFSIMALSFLHYTKAEATPEITVESMNALKGESVDVAVMLSEGTGVAMTQFELVFDSSQLRLDDVTAGTVLANPTIGKSAEHGWVTFVWEDTKGTVAGGILMTLSFTVLADEGETCTIGFDPSYDFVFADNDMITLACDRIAGAVSSMMLGDIDNNGIVQISDALLACRALAGKIALSAEQMRIADMDRDASLNIRDVVSICKKIIGI